MKRKLPIRKNIRLENYDYSDGGGYFITVCAKDRKCLFGNVNKNCVKINCDEKDMILLSDVGQIVENAICHIEESYNHLVELDKHIVMPNHIHLILFLSGRKSDEGGRPMTAPTVSQIVNQLKGAVTKAVGCSVWQKSFYDHIIRNKDDYVKIWNYIDNNPQKWTMDKYYCEW